MSAGDLKIVPGHLVALFGSWLAIGCSGTLDAGGDRAPLPISAENPVILCNDNVYDNWQGEYALLLAQRAGSSLAGIVVSTGSAWLDLDANLRGWQTLTAAARQSGMANVPEPTSSATEILRRPADGVIESTVGNGSEGARFLAQTSRSLAEPGRPVVVATGGRLTDVADAYLFDPTIADRIVVVASIGSGFSANGGAASMGVPNGEEDPWADTIVAERLRYVQVSARYDPLTDVPTARLGELPDNEFGAWIGAKQAGILSIQDAADQVSVIAAGIPEFTSEVARVSAVASNREPPALVEASEGPDWLVTRSNGSAATERFWQLLLSPATFGR